MNIKTALIYGNGFRSTVIVDLIDTKNDSEIIDIINKHNPIKNASGLYDTYWEGDNMYAISYYSEGRVIDEINVYIETVLEHNGRYFTLNERFYRKAKVVE